MCYKFEVINMCRSYRTIYVRKVKYMPKCFVGSSSAYYRGKSWNTLLKNGIIYSLKSCSEFLYPAFYSCVRSIYNPLYEMSQVLPGYLL